MKGSYAKYGWKLVPLHNIAPSPGVHWNKNKWRARIHMQDESRDLGRHDTEEAAARAYDAEVKRVWANPVLNFLPDGSLNPDRKHRRCSR